jgi:ABC-type nitrate/sulfonate/bicarbonate transport system permease component
MAVGNKVGTAVGFAVGIPVGFVVNTIELMETLLEQDAHWQFWGDE